jgi:hypothetical protein
LDVELHEWIKERASTAGISIGECVRRFIHAGLQNSG